MNKKINNRVLIALVVFIFFLAKPVLSFAAEEEYKLLDAKYDVQINKEWKIDFSKELNKYTVNSINIKVVDEKGTTFSTTVTLDENNKSVLVVPKNYYEYGKKYTLIISDRIKSKNNKILEKPIKMKFTIEEGNDSKGLFSELPDDEEGFIIIDDTLYSIEYFNKETNQFFYDELYDEIKDKILNNKYIVYHQDKYSTSLVESRIKDNFKLASFDMEERENAKVHLYDEIKYVDRTGEIFTYAYDNIDKVYKLIVPNVYIDVYSRTASGDSMIKVSSVDGVQDAVKFKFEDDEKIYDIGSSVVNNFDVDKETIYILSEDDYILAVGIVNPLISNEGFGKLTLEHLGYYEKIEDRTNVVEEDLIINYDEYGNSPGNIINNGYVASNDKNFIFYVNTGDENRLYKLQTDGDTDIAISNDYAQYVNSYNGWLYYSNYDDDGKLYRVKEDGSAREKLVDDMAAYVTVYSGWVYYSNHSDGGRLYRIRIKENNEVDEDFITEEINGRRHGKPITDAYKDETAYLNVLGNKIVYTNMSDEFKVYSIVDTYKSTLLQQSDVIRKKLANEWMEAIHVEGENVFFTTSEGDINMLRLVDDKIIPLKGVVRKFDKGYHLNAYKGWIYYSNAVDDGKLYKINIDGSGEKVKLSDDTVTYINIIDDYLYYVSEDKLYRMLINRIGKTEPEEITKKPPNRTIIEINDIKKIVPYDKVNEDIEDLEKEFLPEKVPAIMSDNTMQQLAVDWDKVNVEKRQGTYIYDGEVIGYDIDIKLELFVPSEMLNENNEILVYNNPQYQSDIVIVRSEYENSLYADPPKLIIDDILNIYEDEYLEKSLGSAKVFKEGKYNKAVFENLELDTLGRKSYYITVTRQNKGESLPTEIRTPDAPTILSAGDRDVKAIGVSLKDFQIDEFLNSRIEDSDNINELNIEQYKLYLLPSNTSLNMNSEEIREIDTLDIDETNWVYEKLEQKLIDGGKNQSEIKNILSKDSSENIIKKGKYNGNIAVEFTGFGSPDGRGEKPVLKGYVSSQNFTFDIGEDSLPNKPVITEKKFKPLDQIDLSFTPGEGETVYIVPEDILFDNSIPNLNGWLSESDEPWYYDEASVEFPQGGEGYIDVENNLVTYLVGNNKDKIVFAPQLEDGIVGNEARRYRVVLKNNVGVSEPSDNAIILDNQSPNYEVYNREIFDISKTEGNAGEEIIVWSDEDSTAYLVPMNAQIDYNIINVEMLEEAIANSSNAVKFKVNKKEWYDNPTTYTKINTTRLYSNFTSEDDDPQPEYNYIVILVDEVGNIATSSEQENYLNIIINAKNLKELLRDALTGFNELDNLDPMYDIKFDLLNSAYNKAEAFYNNAENFRNSSQQEVNDEFDELKETMINVGIINCAFYNDSEKAQAAANSLYLIYRDSSAVDIQEGVTKLGDERYTILDNLELSNNIVGHGDISIAWTTDSSEINSAGTVLRDEISDVNVKLFALVNCNGVTVKRTFYSVVPHTGGNEIVEFTIPSRSNEVFYDQSDFVGFEGTYTKTDGLYDENSGMQVYVRLKNTDNEYLNDDGTYTIDPFQFSAQLDGNGKWKLAPEELTINENGNYTVEAWLNDGDDGIKAVKEIRIMWN